MTWITKLFLLGLLIINQTWASTGSLFTITPYGQGSFKKNTSQLLNTLSTGTDYSNAVICSVTV